MAQTATPIVNGGTYYEFKNGVRIDSALFLPRRDTTVTDLRLKAPGMLLYRPQDSLLYYLKGNTMTALGGGSGANINIYNSNGILSGNRTLTGNQRAYNLLFDSINVFTARGNSFLAVAQNTPISTVALTSLFLQYNQSNWRAITTGGQSMNVQVDGGISTTTGRFSITAGTSVAQDLFYAGGQESPNPGITFPQLKNNVSGDSLLTTNNSGKVILVNKNTIGGGITSLNALTSPIQTFTTGTAGSDFNIASAGATHIFNIPTASITNRGAVGTGAQTFGGDKTFAGSITTESTITLKAASGTPTDPGDISFTSNAGTEQARIAATVGGGGLALSSGLSLVVLDALTGRTSVGTGLGNYKFNILSPNNAALGVENNDILSSTSGGIGHFFNSGIPSVPDLRLGGIAIGSTQTGPANIGASIFGFSSDGWTPASRPTYLAFSTTASGSITPIEAMRITADGDIAVGSTTAPTSKMHVSGAISLPITTITANTILDNTHHTLRVTTAGITLTFPAASSCNGRMYGIINYNTGGAVNTSAFLTPLAISTTTVSSGTIVWVQSDGANWYQIR